MAERHRSTSRLSGLVFNALTSSRSATDRIERHDIQPKVLLCKGRCTAYGHQVQIAINTAHLKNMHLCISPIGVFYCFICTVFVHLAFPFEASLMLRAIRQRKPGSSGLNVVMYSQAHFVISYV